MNQPETAERLMRLSNDATARLQVRSALNPLLWLCAIVTPATLMASGFAAGNVQIMLLVIGAVPVLCACIAYAYLVVKDPNRLHSEDYQLRRQALEMIHEKGASSGVLASSVIAITNPERPMLSNKAE
jgi:hypothetical protein